VASVEEGGVVNKEWHNFFQSNVSYNKVRTIHEYGPSHTSLRTFPANLPLCYLTIE
jgi:hypothetical protein